MVVGDPAIATIDQNGVFTALAEGTAILRATANEGTTRTISLPTPWRSPAPPRTTPAMPNSASRPTPMRAIDIHRAARTVHGVVQQHARHAKLGELRSRSNALRA
jgi:hypothetical protein